MSSIALRPRSATELVDAAFQVFKREPLQFILAIALLYVPWLLVRVVFDIGMDDTALPTPSQTVATVMGVLIVYTLGSGVITVIASDVYLGKRPDIARAYRTVITHLAPLFSTMIVVNLAIFAGALLFVIPVFYVIARFFAIRQAILLEGKGSLSALSRTSELTVGHKWHVLKTLVLIFLIVLAILTGSTMLLGIIPNRIVRAVISTVVTVIVYPTLGITDTLLYYDLRIRKEGFDVEYMAGQTSSGVMAVDTSATPL